MAQKVLFQDIDEKETARKRAELRVYQSLLNLESEANE